MPDDDFYKRTTSPGIGGKTEPEIPVQNIPKFIGKYRIESLLEKGGMSLVYLGTHPDTKEPTIIKVLSPKYLSHPEIVQRFLNEAEIIAMADHPNIVKLHGYGEWEGGLYIAMEFIQGISLRQYILQTPVSLKKALEITIDIAYALCHLHTHGVIHRDLKPENILMTENGVIKVIDFGIAQLLTEKTLEEEAARKRIIGTPIYMSPEQRENPESVSYPSDLYSLGIITYELILGKLSHGQIHLSMMPKGIHKILIKTLQPNPKNRYQDVVDFIADISAYLNSTHLQKEKKVGDQLSELSENFRRTQQVLLPEVLPSWPELETQVAINKNFNISGVYHEFLRLSEGKYGVLLCESSARDAEGFIYMSILKGMILTLQRLTNRASEMATILNEMVLNESFDYVFTFNLLIFDPNGQRFQYISCGSSGLWVIPPDNSPPVHVSQANISLGIDRYIEFKEVEFPWVKGTRLVLGSVAGLLSNPGLDQEFSGEQIQSALIEFHDLSTKLLVEGLLRKAKASPKQTEQTICFIGIQLN